MKIINNNDYDLLDLDKNDIFNALNKHGIVIFNGFNANSEVFSEFGKKLTNNFIDQGATKLRDPISEDGVVSTVVKGNMELPLHMERGYSPLKPDFCLFLGVETAPMGGALTICDGIKIFKKLTLETQSLLKNNKLKYTHKLDKETWQQRYGNEIEVNLLFSNHPSVISFQITNDEDLEYQYITPAIIKTPSNQYAFVNSLEILWQEEVQLDDFSYSVQFEGNKNISAELIHEIKLACKECEIEHLLQPKQIVLLDNNRFMHGRRSFEGNRKTLAIFGISAQDK